MSFEDAVKEGRLEEARALLDELERAPDTDGRWLLDSYADLAQAFDRRAIRGATGAHGPTCRSPPVSG